MIPAIPFPCFSALALDLVYPPIPCFNVAIAPFALTETRISARWNDRLYRGPTCSRPVGQCPMDFPSIIGAVAIKPSDGPGRLLKHRLDLRRIIRAGDRQRLCHHFPRVGIQAQMQFVPGSPLGPTLLTDLPLAFAIQLQPRAIGDQMFRGVAGMDRQINRPIFLSPRQGRMIGRFQGQTHRRQQRLDKTFGLPQRQLKQFSQRQSRLNGQTEYTNCAPHWGEPA